MKLGSLKFLAKIKLIKDYQKWERKVNKQIELFHQDLKILKRKKKKWTKNTHSNVSGNLPILEKLQVSFYLMTRPGLLVKF